MPTGGNGHAPVTDPDRLGRIEAILAEVQRQLDAQFKRMADLQVQMDRTITGDRLKPTR